jgi:GTP-binding protein Era
MKESEEEDALEIYATIFVERDSQKKIIIGHNGEMIKKVKQIPLKDIKKLLDRTVHLDLWVKLKKDWKDRPDDLRALGYSTDNF